MPQRNPTIYATAIQYQLSTLLSPIPVYANFNRNWANEPKFVTWQIRNIHQPVYTGSLQTVKGIDRPNIRINVFATTMAESFTISNTIVQSWHGYSGPLGDPNGTTVPVAKIDVTWLYNEYENDTNLFQVFLDCALDVPS